jgi:prepilin peptidase CpaA
MYLFRLIGAGDVKLFAAAAVWIGPRGALTAALITALTGALLGAGWMLWRRGPTATIVTLMQLFQAPSQLQLPPVDRLQTIPYAIAVSVGVLSAWFRPLVLTP